MHTLTGNAPPCSKRPGKPGADGRRTLHYDLVTEVPELRGDRIVLSAHTDSEAAAHAAGEDEETARRFGWWPGTLDRGDSPGRLRELGRELAGRRPGQGVRGP
jgi:hypothetical protein